MSHRNRSLLLGGVTLCAIYILGLSFWSRSAGEAYRERELARDEAYHEAMERGDRATVQALADRLVRESENDFTGEEAMRLGGVGLIVLVLAYGVAAHVYLRRVGDDSASSTRG